MIIDKFSFVFSSDVDYYVDQLVDKHPWISHHSNHVRRLIKRIREKLETSVLNQIHLDRTFKSHKLPVTHAAINKTGTL